jgi:hypothetical protein
LYGCQTWSLTIREEFIFLHRNYIWSLFIYVLLITPPQREDRGSTYVLNYKKFRFLKCSAEWTFPVSYN